MKKAFWGCVIGVFFLLQTEVVIAMSLIGFKVCLASEMKATVTYQGKPAEDAVVTRVVNFNNKDYTTETRTDSAGNFILPALYERTIWKHTPFETLMFQVVTITHNSESHKGVALTKRNFDPDGELNSIVGIERGYFTFTPYEFTCELTDEEFGRSIDGTGGTIRGKCLLESEINLKKTANKE